MDQNYWQKTRVSRRTALRSTGLGIAGLAGAALIGCTGNSDTTTAPTATGTATASVAEKPKPGGTLKHTARNDTAHLDVSKEASLASLMSGSTMYSQLVRYDASKLPDQRVIVGDLAEKWEVTNGGQSVTFSLRKGVNFHDGKPFTSADVVSTMERAKKVNPLRDLFANVTTVEAPDANTVVFKMAKPASFLIDLLAAPTSAIMPKHVITVDEKALETKPNGTGPFMFESWSKGVNISVKKNPNYFIKGIPYLDGVSFIQVADNAAEVNGVRTGQLQVTNQTPRITETDLKQIRSDVPNIQVRHPVCGCTDVMYMNNTKAPFNDLRVRRAVNFLIDQPKVAELLRGGAAQPGSYIFGSGLSEEDRKKAIPGYDGISDAEIAEAKKLMDAAGHKDGFTVEFKEGDNFGANFLTFYRSAFGKAGIKLDPDVRLKYPAEIFSTLQKLDYTLANTAAIFAMIHPTSFLGINTTGNVENKTGYSNKDYDAMFQKLLTSVDPKEVADLTVQMEKKLIEDVPWVNCSTPVYNMVIRPEVGGYNGPKYLRDYFDLAEVYLRA